MSAKPDMPAIRAAALDMTARGFRVISVRGKIPIGTEWESREISRERVEVEFSRKSCNIGLVAGRDLVILDADEEVGVATLHREFPALPPTMVADTPRNGEHWVYARAAHQDFTKLSAKPKFLEKLDLRVGNSQIVIAPSVHENGKQYRWREGCPREPTLLPDWVYERLVELCPAKNEESRDSGIHIKTAMVHVPSAMPPSEARRGTYEEAARYIAQIPGAVAGNNGHDTTWDVACRLHHSFPKITDEERWVIFHSFNARCKPMWSQSELDHKFESARNDANPEIWRLSDRPPPHRSAMLPPGGAQNDDAAPPYPDGALTRAGRNGSVVVQPNEYNAALWLDGLPETKGRIRWNELNQCCELATFPVNATDGGSLTGRLEDHHATQILAWLQAKKAPEFAPLTIQRVIPVVARRNSYNPLREFLTSLKWDGLRRLDTWLPVFCGAEDSAYTRAVSRYFLLGAVARALSPKPVKVDTVLILTGAQGVGKSTALRVLGGEWFADMAIDLESKDRFEAIQGVWIVELSELDAIRRKDATKVKAYLTSEVDVYRPSYGREAVARTRRCVFAGTSNETSFLTDHTGGRRFWPVAVCEDGRESVDTRGLALYRDQLLAEAVVAYQADARWWPEGEENAWFVEPQEDARVVDAREDTLRQWLAGRTETTVQEILASKVPDFDKQTQGIQEITRSVLTAIGWTENRRSRYDRRRVFRPKRRLHVVSDPVIPGS